MLPGLNLPAATRQRKPIRKPATPSGRARKGGRVEREIVALIRDLGIECRKVPLSGALAKRLGADFRNQGCQQEGRDHQARRRPGRPEEVRTSSRR